MHDLHEHLADLLDNAPNYDYIVGWLDATAGGRASAVVRSMLRDICTKAKTRIPHKTMQLKNQILPPRIFGVFPKSMLYLFMRPFVNNLGVWAVNTGKYIASLRRHTFRQSHAAFHFLLDYVPNWERAYGRGGLIQYQSFLPKENAEDAWCEMSHLSLKRGLPSYLGVTKRHRPDKFLLSHAVDGFSAAWTSRSRMAIVPD